MKREKYSDELKVNMIFDREKRFLNVTSIARKFGVDYSGAKKAIQSFYSNRGKECSVAKIEDFGGEFFKIALPDEELQSAAEKIAFYKEVAEKYKAAARAIEKSEKILLRDRKILFSKQVEKCLENHENTEIDGKWKMSRDEFMEFFSKFGET